MDLVQQAVDSIVRPPRAKYDYMELPLVLDTGEENSPLYIRHPITIDNKRGQKLICSLYHSPKMDVMTGGPCVMYLHGNASSQNEGHFLVPNICNYGVFVFCFDFAGCGCSDGDYISLGYYEKQDTEYLIAFLNDSFRLGPFVLWGRSMGAATSLLIRSGLLVGVIADSSFTSISGLCESIAIEKGVPSLITPMVMWLLKTKIESLVGFSINDVSPLKSVETATVPLVIGHATYDKMIPYEHCEMLFEKYACEEKIIVPLPGGHNSKRENIWISECVKFILNRFHIYHSQIVVCECRKLQSKEAHFSSFAQLFDKVNK